MTAIKILYILILAFFVQSCTEEPPPTLSTKDKELVDSLYIKEVTRIKPIFDSLCADRMDERVKRAVDSMLIERRKEIGNQLERIKELTSEK